MNVRPSPALIVFDAGRALAAEIGEFPAAGGGPIPTTLQSEASILIGIVVRHLHPEFWQASPIT
jgi:hypothetical protein